MPCYCWVGVAVQHPPWPPLTHFGEALLLLSRDESASCLLGLLWGVGAPCYSWARMEA